jgi:hypothetical protein
MSIPKCGAGEILYHRWDWVPKSNGFLSYKEVKQGELAVVRKYLFYLELLTFQKFHRNKIHLLPSTSHVQVPIPTTQNFDQSTERDSNNFEQLLELPFLSPHKSKTQLGASLQVFHCILRKSYESRHHDALPQEDL